MTMIVLSILVTVFGDMGKARRGHRQELSMSSSGFCARTDFVAVGGNALASLAKGELWRTVTPIFIHLDSLHIIFNMIMFFQFGALGRVAQGYGPPGTA